MASDISPRDTDMLLIVDVQNDFCPGGALPITGGHEVVPIINRLSGLFAHRVLTQDWHPAGHHSFASRHTGKAPFEQVDAAYGPQILWPDHCVQGTPGAAFHPELETDGAELVIRKGFRPTIDSYSAFYENDKATPTGLKGYLQDRDIGRVFITGLALDVCVRYSAEDAQRCGFETLIVTDACRAVDMNGSHAGALASFETLGIACIESSQIG